MKTFIAGGLAALTVGSALATAAPAAAEPYYHHRHNDAGVAVAAGIAGLAIGAALAGDHNGYAYDRGYYAPRTTYYYRQAPAYYAAPAYYGYGYRCHVERRWNYQWGGYDRVRVCY